MLYLSDKFLSFVDENDNFSIKAYLSQEIFGGTLDDCL